ncbi:hypothetical protein WMF26_00785 [Sorangium sp. So ce185]|uniref:hypothetical protein n=1 Tax=Sorangium sp. So ce185 TaxID=3133287 RepID=UPI003F6094BA
MSISLRGREAVALAMAVAAHLAILAAPTPERPPAAPAGPQAAVDGIDIELEPPAARGAAAAPAGGEAVASAPEEAGEVGKAAPAEKTPAPAPGAAAAKVASTERARPAPAAPAAPAAEPKEAPEAAAPEGAVPDSAPPEATAPAAEAAAPGAEAPGPVAESPAPAEAPGPVAEAPGPPAAAPPGGEYGGPPPAAGGGVALAPGIGTPLWSVPGLLPGPDAPRAAPTAAPRAQPLDPAIAGKVLNETLHSKDKSVGISVPAAGVVASTLADTVRASAAPLDARATFEVKLGADGQVLGVRLVSATAGDGPTWDRIVDAAKGALAGSALQMGPDRQPVTVTVKVQSKVQYPSGSKKKPTPELVCAEEVLEQLQQAVENPNMIGDRRGLGGGAAAADMDEEERKRLFCIPIGLRVKGDLSDVGAHRINVVSASFAVKREGERALPHEDILPIDTRVPWAPKDPKKTKPPPKPKKKWKKKKQQQP